MRIDLLCVRHASPVSAVPTAAGPRRLLEAGLEDRLRSAGHDVTVHEIDAPDGDPRGAIGREFALAAAIAARVREARDGGRLPVVLSGSCHAALGCVAALGERRPGVVWLDAHGDFNTPETTGSGLLDGMIVATITGRCWAGLRSTVPGFEALDDRSVLMLGVRELDAAEGELLEESDVTVLSPPAVRGGLDVALAGLAQRVDPTYVHLDLDVLDASDGRANAFASTGGLTRDELAGALESVRKTCGIQAITLASYDPGADTDGAACEAALEAVTSAVGRA